MSPMPHPLQRMTMSATLRSYPRPRRARERLSPEQLNELVTAAASGAGHGWDLLVREFGDMIWAIARAHRLCDADAADVAQATWLRLFEQLSRVHDPAR